MKGALKKKAKYPMKGGGHTARCRKTKAFTTEMKRNDNMIHRMCEGESRRGAIHAATKYKNGGKHGEKDSLSLFFGWVIYESRKSLPVLF